MTRLLVHWPILAVLLLAAALRTAVVVERQAELGVDRDAYLGIATSLAEGRGYSGPGATTPTAYRPPLYPLLLSLAPGENFPLWVAITNVLLGTATVGLTWGLGRKLGLSGLQATLAALVVACDPLLLRYTSLPMTETLSGCLVTILVGRWTMHGGRRGSSDEGGAAEGERGGAESSVSSLVAGIIFGLCVLCRPTLWPLAGMVAALVILRGIKLNSGPESNPALRRHAINSLFAAALGCALAVAPWGIRNALAFGRPILTTTHGGYTLLLGNNRAFYDEVVSRGWTVVWEDSPREGHAGQAAWLRGIQDEMAREEIEGEVAQDRWMNRRAIEEIRQQPALFARACLLRLFAFWGVTPHGEGAQGMPAWLMWGVGLYLLAVLMSAAVGMISVVVQRDARWALPLLAVLCLMLVHTVYWSNTRMRAPVEPILAIAAVRGISEVRRAFLPRGNRTAPSL